MDNGRISLLLAAVSASVTLITYWLTKESQEARARREERRKEYREMVSTLTQCYMRIVSPYEPPIPVIDEQLQRQITDAKLESFRVLQDRIAIAAELADTDVLDVWTEAVVSSRAERGLGFDLPRNSSRSGSGSLGWQTGRFPSENGCEISTTALGISGRIENSGNARRALVSTQRCSITPVFFS